MITKKSQVKKPSAIGFFIGAFLSVASIAYFTYANTVLIQGTLPSASQWFLAFIGLSAVGFNLMFFNAATGSSKQRTVSLLFAVAFTIILVLSFAAVWLQSVSPSGIQLEKRAAVFFIATPFIHVILAATGWIMWYFTKYTNFSEKSKQYFAADRPSVQLTSKNIPIFVQTSLALLLVLVWGLITIVPIFAVINPGSTLWGNLLGLGIASSLDISSSSALWTVSIIYGVTIGIVLFPLLLSLAKKVVYRTTPTTSQHAHKSWVKVNSALPWIAGTAGLLITVGLRALLNDDAVMIYQTVLGVGILLFVIALGLLIGVRKNGVPVSRIDIKRGYSPTFNK